MSRNEQISMGDFSSLPQDILLEIARDCLLPRTNQLEIREWVHSNQINLELLLVNTRGRIALLEILRRETLWIEVAWHECQHIANIDPRDNEPAIRALLGEGTHPNLEDVFGNTAWDPALRLREAGYLVHTLQLNMRCGQLCGKEMTRPSKLAFIPANLHHILALCPIIQRMQKPAGTDKETAYVEIQSGEIGQQFPIVRRKARRVLDLILHILPGSYHGTLTDAAVHQADQILENYYGSAVDIDGWPIMQPFISRYLAELEASLAAGAPVHEHASLVEGFLNNKLSPHCGSHGEDREISHETFLSIFSIYNKYHCIFMDGLAEFLLRRDANQGGQTHHVLDAISTDETHFLWHYFNRVMYTTGEWARKVLLGLHYTDTTNKPSKHNVSFYIQCVAVRLAEIRLRFAMARARRCQPALHVFQDACYISKMAMPHSIWIDNMQIAQQMGDCVGAIKLLLEQISILVRTYEIETPELVAVWARAEELNAIIHAEARFRPYVMNTWPLSAGIDRRPVLTLPAAEYQVFQVENNNDVLCLVGELREKGVFARVQ